MEGTSIPGEQRKGSPERPLLLRAWPVRASPLSIRNRYPSSIYRKGFSTDDVSQPYRRRNDHRRNQPQYQAYRLAIGPNLRLGGYRRGDNPRPDRPPRRCRFCYCPWLCRCRRRCPRHHQHPPLRHPRSPKPVPRNPIRPFRTEGKDPDGAVTRGPAPPVVRYERDAPCWHMARDGERRSAGPGRPPLLCAGRLCPVQPPVRPAARAARR